MRVRFRKPDMEPAFQRVLKAATDATGYTADELTGRNKRRALVGARRGVMVALSNAGFSNVEIGDAFGELDTATVLVGIRSAKKLRKKDPEYDRYIGALGRAIG